MSFVLNAIIAAVTGIITLHSLLRDKMDNIPDIKMAFRYFTVQSNAFCGFAALCMCLAPRAEWAWLLKYMATAAVSVTLFTVMFYLAPALGSVKKLIQKENLFLHLITPLLALTSFCIWEKRGMKPWIFLLGLLPVVLYAGLYLKKVVFTHSEKKWDDIYGFNRDGRWPVSLAAMLLITLMICLVLSWVQNL